MTSDWTRSEGTEHSSNISIADVVSEWLQGQRRREQPDLTVEQSRVPLLRQELVKILADKNYCTYGSHTKEELHGPLGRASRVLEHRKRMNLLKGMDYARIQEYFNGKRAISNAELQCCLKILLDEVTTIERHLDPEQASEKHRYQKIPLSKGQIALEQLL